MSSQSSHPSIILLLRVAILNALFFPFFFWVMYGVQPECYILMLHTVRLT